MRHAVAAKSNYLSAPAEPAPNRPAMVRGGDVDPLLPHLIERLDHAAAVDIAAAFAMESAFA